MSRPSFSTLEVDRAAHAAGWSREIFASGQAAHTFRMVFEPPTGTAASTRVEIVAASTKLGIASDMIWVTASAFSPAGLAQIVFRSAPRKLTKFTNSTLSNFTAVDIPLPTGTRPAVDDGPGQVVSLGFDLYAVLFKGTVYLIAGDDVNHALVTAGFDKIEAFDYQIQQIPAAGYSIAIAAGDVDANGSQDLVLATQNGQVLWLPGESLLSGDFSAIEDIALGSEWFGQGNPAVPNVHSIWSSGSTWAMTRAKNAQGVPTGEIRAIDQCGRVTEIDRLTGVRTYQHLVTNSSDGVPPPGVAPPGTMPPAPISFAQAKPFRDLGFIGQDPPVLGLPDVYDPFDAGDDLIGAPGVAGSRWRLQTPFDVAVLPGSLAPASTALGNVDYVRTINTQLYDEQFLPFTFGGDVLWTNNGNVRHAYYWSSCPPTFYGPQGANTVRGLTHNLQSGIPFSVFGSSTNTTTTPIGGIGPGFQTNLRNTIAFATPHDCQSLRIGDWPHGLRVILSTVGGGLMAIDPSLPPSTCLVADPPPATHDHGFGGIALCVSDVRGSGVPTIFFGTLHAHANGAGGDLVSSLHIYELLSNDTLAPVGSPILFDGTGFLPKLGGLCGIAVGNLIDDEPPYDDGAEDELVLTTLNGDVVVYDLKAIGGTVTLGAVLHWDVYDGALGAHNSILIDSTSSPRAVFVAGSCGMRKFTVSGT